MGEPPLYPGECEWQILTVSHAGLSGAAEQPEPFQWPTRAGQQERALGTGLWPPVLRPPRLAGAAPREAGVPQGWRSQPPETEKAVVGEVAGGACAGVSGSVTCATTHLSFSRAGLALGKV